MTKLGTFLLFVIFSLTVHGQKHYSDPTFQFKKSQYKKDLQEYVKLIKKNHPQTYSFISKKELNTLKKQKLRELSDSTSLGQFLWACEDIAASIQCGHTFVWWPEDFGLIPDSLLFPVDTWTDGKKLFIMNARNNKDKVAVGSEILRINGVDVNTILKAMYASSPSDGNIESSKKNWINHVFNTMCPMYFNYLENYAVDITTNGTVETVKLEKYQWNKLKTTPANDCADLCLKMDTAKQLGILTLRTFDYYEENFSKFKSFIDSAFTTMNTAAIKHLVVDLRGNQGGDSKCGSYLIEHIANTPYCYWPIDEDATWQKSLHQTIQPNDNRFKGRPYVLIDGGCLSTSGHVGSIIQDHDFATLIGEEMGSTYTCNDNSLFSTLKYTALQYRIPRTTFTTCVSDIPKNKGILPDVEIVPNVNDIINNLDPVMEYVLGQIELK